MADEFLSKALDDNDRQLAASVGRAALVMSAFNTELFLKCLICIETGETPSGHYLADLFLMLSTATRSRVEYIWNTEVVPLRTPMWTQVEIAIGNGKISHNLLDALKAGNRAFEQMRYSYEPDNKNARYYISDLPRLLGRVILELHPEWENLRRTVRELPRDPGGLKRPPDPGK